jgi:hypothetical protein
VNLPINPETKVGALLEAYPGIDEVLIAWVPAFAKLRNPVLRKTVGKVATLEQAARVGGVSVREMVWKLREATGQSGPEVTDGQGAVPAEESAAEAPAWLSKDRVRHTIDANSMLEGQVHPLGRVRECVVALQVGEIVELTSSFRPEPLIDAMARSGLAVYSHEASPGRHHTYFCRQSTDPKLANRIAENSCGKGRCG